MPGKLLNSKEVAEYLNLEPVTVRRKAAKGEIPAIRVGNRFRFDRDQIDTWLSQSATGVPRDILVVDDEPAVGQFIADALAMYGHRVTTTLGGAEALDIVRRKRFDLVFLDLVMPDLDGSEVFKRIREIDAGAKVVIVTGYSDSSVMQRATQYGPFLVIKKPFAIDDILEAVSTFARSTVARS